MDVEVMIFIGFGFLMTFVRRYGFGAVGFNFFCSCLVTLTAVIVIGAVQQGLHKGLHMITLDLPLLIDSTFCAGSAMIAFGAVLGKTTPTQLMWLMLGLVPLYALNQHICFVNLEALDMGGSITIHVFGAYYGLAASLMLSNGRQTLGAYSSANPKNRANYISNLFSMIGTLFLWMYWPSFNGALASIEAAQGDSHALDSEDMLKLPQQYYCVVNTLLSLLGSCVSTFATSSLLNRGKFDIMHVQNATLAGGVAMGSSAALRLAPGGAVAVGLFAGTLSTLGFGMLSPFLERVIGLGDTCGVHNLHGLPGLLGGLIAGIAALGQAPGIAPHGQQQLAYQVAALVCTVAIAEVAIDGLALFDDGAFWTDIQVELPLADVACGSFAGHYASTRNGSYHSAAAALGQARLPTAGANSPGKRVTQKELSISNKDVDDHNTEPGEHIV
eukprot:gene8850-9029_t